MHKQTITTAILIVGIVLLFTLKVYADPTGATILSNSSAGAPSPSAGSRTDARGTITILELDAQQQDPFWKGYVGNVSGRLSLDDGDGFTIYDWSLVSGISGEVYVSRWASPVFTNVSCANYGNVSQEETYFGMTTNAADNINNTYNYSRHDAVTIGGFGTITLDTCKSMATFVNDTDQNMTDPDYQALVLQDGSQQLIFVTLISDNAYGYHNNISMNKTYDFQIIVPESATNSTSTTYYFWTELDG